MPKYKTIDLCAGIGGIRKGFEKTERFENVLSAEIDEPACRTYEHLYHEDPRNDITTSQFRGKAKRANYNVMLAGFPCQAFSRAGKKMGFKDKVKGTIFFDLIKIINMKRPDALFLENVDSLLNHDGGNTFKTIIEILELNLNYKVIGVKQTKKDGKIKLEYEKKDFVRNTINFGLPQNRPRVYIMAFNRKKFGIRKVNKLNNYLPDCGKNIIFETVDDILDVNVDYKYYLSSGYFQTLINHKERNKGKGNGFGYRILNEDGNHLDYAHTIMATGGSGRERNLIIDQRDGVAGRMVQGKKSELNGRCVRVMTPTEWGRLQGFIGYAFLDDDGVEHFSFPDNMSDIQKYKQFGNSVSIPVIEEMASFMADCLDFLYE